MASSRPVTARDQDLAQAFAREQFAGRIPELERLLPLFMNTGIDTRHFAAPTEWFLASHDLAEKSAMYVREATRLSARAARDVLERAELKPADVDYVIYVNTTGLATPSIDARLINELGLRTDVRRTPIWGLGCAGGVAGLAHAHHHALGHPGQRVLVIATELCGLTFMPEDDSPANLVATALFADGAGAVLVEGDGLAGEGLAMIDTRSRFYRDSLDVMGWTVLQQGLQVVFARRIPEMVADTAAEDAGGFLADHGLTLGDIDAFILHPGGTKVLEAYETALGLVPTQLDLARSVLRDYGNMSSATVLFVLERYLQENAPGRGGYGLVSALGPGFCSASVLLAL